MIILSAAVLAVALYCFHAIVRRPASEVLEDLQRVESGRGDEGPAPVMGASFKLELWDKEEEAKHRQRANYIPLAAILAALCSQLFIGASLQEGLVYLMLGGALGYLIRGSRIRSFQARWSEELEYFLPIVMERIVMAVQSGMDVVPALEAMVELDEKAAAMSGQQTLDPVTRLLRLACRLTESGISFEQALKDISGHLGCTAVKHAFIYLAIAQREGGELLRPLRELAEATQLQYQDAVEERIAALPVKATVPLLCTFAGLIICFLTTPLVQVMGMTGATLPR